MLIFGYYIYIISCCSCKCVAAWHSRMTRLLSRIKKDHLEYYIKQNKARINNRRCCYWLYSGFDINTFVSCRRLPFVLPEMSSSNIIYQNELSTDINVTANYVYKFISLL